MDDNYNPVSLVESNRAAARKAAAMLEFNLVEAPPKLNRHYPEMNYTVADCHGEVPNLELISEIYIHSGNGHEYVITGYTWMSATDEWGIIHQRYDKSSSLSFVRSLGNFFGQRGGIARFRHKP